jgi:Cysteine-rich secretory protein family
LQKRPASTAPGPRAACASEQTWQRRQRNFYGHDSPEGKGVGDRFQKAGGKQWQMTAENIARCTNYAVNMKTVEDLHGGWMNSKAHRENILRKGITECGFSLVGAPGKPMYAVRTFAGPGFGGGMAGTLGKKVSEKEAVAVALELLDAERKKAGKPPLAESPALTKALRSMVPSGKVDGFSLSQTGKVMDALPEKDRDDWANQKILAFAFACGGCGIEPTDADVRFFVRECMDKPGNKATLMDGDFAHMGFALVASGKGKKVALSLLGKKQPQQAAR